MIELRPSRNLDDYICLNCFSAITLSLFPSPRRYHFVIGINLTTTTAATAVILLVLPPLIITAVILS